MEEQFPQQSSSNTFLTYVSHHRYMFFFAGIALILFLIVFFIALISGSNIKKPTITTTRPVKISPSLKTTIGPKQPYGSSSVQTTIKTQTKSQLDKKITVPYTVSVVKPYNDSWAIMEVTNPDTDPANVVLEKVNGSWQVVLGPGTHFDQQQLQAIGAPENLIKDANSNL